MELRTIIPHIEALIFASDKPLSVVDLAELINTAMGFIEDLATTEQVEAAISAIAEKYNSEFYSFEIVESGGGWQFLTKKEYHQTVAQLNGDKFLKKLSVAAIETLSIIAYKQPVTKSEIELIRGVNCDYAVQKLLEKDLVVISGRREDAPGKPLIYSTSKSFMDYFGINSADDLPKIKEVLDQEIIEATEVMKESEDEVQAGEQPISEEGISVELTHIEIVSETSQEEEALPAAGEDASPEVGPSTPTEEEDSE